MLVFGHLGITLLLAFVIFSVLKEDVDYRFVLVGGLLPDIIDKPIGDYIFYSIFQNGRIFSHTLLFVAVVTLIGATVTRKYKVNFVELLALGSLFHIAEDQVWRVQGTLFWPLFGWEFPKFNLEDYAGYILYVLFHNPDAYVPELIGISILAVFVGYFRLYKRDNLKTFLYSGKLASERSPVPATA